MLYFLSRISVEPLMVAFMALAFLALWRAQDSARAGDRRAQLGWVAASALAAVSGAVSKLSFLGPLPFLLALLLVVDPGRPDSWRRRGGALALYLAVALASLALYSTLIDWHRFRGVWSMIAQASVKEGWSLAAFAPGLGARSIFLSAEIPFVVASLLGIVAYLRSRRPERRRAAGFGVYLGFGAALWAYRVSLEGSFLPFHYFFVAQAGLALGFGFGLAAVLRRFALHPGLGLAAIAILHAVAAAAVVDARRHDARMYAERRPVLEAVARLGPRDRLGVVSRRGALPREGLRIKVHGLSFPSLFNPWRSKLRDEFEGLLMPVRPTQIPPGTPSVFVPLWGRKIVILPDPASLPTSRGTDRPMYPRKR